MKQSLRKVHKLIQEKQLSEAVSSYRKLIEAEPQYADINNFYKTFYFAEPESFYVYERGNAGKHFLTSNRILLKKKLLNDISTSAKKNKKMHKSKAGTLKMLKGWSLKM